jgi:hypothetical protein
MIGPSEGHQDVNDLHLRRPKEPARLPHRWHLTRAESSHGNQHTRFLILLACYYYICSPLMLHL